MLAYKTTLHANTCYIYLYVLIYKIELEQVNQKKRMVDFAGNNTLAGNQQ